MFVSSWFFLLEKDTISNFNPFLIWWLFQGTMMFLKSIYWVQSVLAHVWHVCQLSPSLCHKAGTGWQLHKLCHCMGRRGHHIIPLCSVVSVTARGCLPLLGWGEVLCSTLFASCWSTGGVCGCLGTLECTEQHLHYLCSNTRWHNNLVSLSPNSLASENGQQSWLTSLN